MTAIVRLSLCFVMVGGVLTSFSDHHLTVVEASEPAFLDAHVERSRYRGRFSVRVVAPVQLGRLAVTGDRLTVRGVTLRELVRFAYSRPLPYQVDGGPSWVDSLYFDIEATMPPGARRSDYPSMLRALLRDRFGLATTMVHRDMSVQALVTRAPDKGVGTRLRDSREECSSGSAAAAPGQAKEVRACGVVTGRRHSPTGASVFTIRGRHVTMPVLAEHVSQRLTSPVVDHTGLTGHFDFDVQFPGPDLEEEAGAEIRRFMTALEDQLGLSLRRTRAAVDVLLIERAVAPVPQ